MRAGVKISFRSYSAKLELELYDQIFLLYMVTVGTDWGAIAVCHSGVCSIIKLCYPRNKQQSYPINQTYTSYFIAGGEVWAPFFITKMEG